MAWTHTSPDGFSRRHNAEDHFSTSLDIGDHIARVVLAQCLDAAARHRIAEPWIVDVGAGSGRLLQQLLVLGFPAERLLGVDVRPAPDLPVRWVHGVAPDCLPRLPGLLFAHEFLDDVPVEVLDGGRVRLTDGSAGPLAGAQDVAWQDRWGGPVSGRRRDSVWAALVSRVQVGRAIAVDYMGGTVAGHRSGRSVAPSADGRTDISAGVDLRACRAATGGRLVPQHRMLADRVGHSPQEVGELAALRDRTGLGAFGWLITDVASVGSPA